MNELFKRLVQSAGPETFDFSFDSDFESEFDVRQLWGVTFEWSVPGAGVTIANFSTGLCLYGGVTFANFPIVCFQLRGVTLGRFGLPLVSPGLPF